MKRTKDEKIIAALLSTPTIREAASVAGHEAAVKALQELIETVRSIEFDGEIIYKAYNRQARKHAVMEGW